MFNQYFEDLRDKVDKNGYGSISIGDLKALGAYEETLINGGSLFEVDELPSRLDLPDFVASLRKAKVRRIFITQGDDNLFDSLFALEDLGCSVLGLETFRRIAKSSNFNVEDEFVRGIEVAITEPDW